jgi:hypothetical protein
LHEGSSDPIKPAIEIGAGRHSKVLLELVDALLSPYSKDRPQSAKQALLMLQKEKTSAEPQESIPDESDIEKTIVLATETPNTAIEPSASSTQDQTEEFSQCHRLSKQGNINAQFELGMMYAYGRGCKKNESSAREWLEKAANSGHSLAQSRLGIMLARGIGIKKSEQEGAKWLKNAAHNGDSSAQFNYGMLCAHGIGVQQDTKQAIHWYAKAAQQGHTGASSNLEILATRNNGQRHKHTVLFFLTILALSFFIWRYWW